MKTQSNDLPVDKVFWPSNICVPVASKSFDPFIDVIVDRCIGVSGKALKTSEKKTYRIASRWFLYGLLQSHFSIPSVPLAMPMSPVDYGKSGFYQIPFGFKILKKIIKVAFDLGICSVELGIYNPYGKGKITRLRPAGALLDEFDSTGIKWEYIEPPPKYQAVCMRSSTEDKAIHYVDRRVSSEVARMQDVMLEINTFLSRQCISIELPNQALRVSRNPKRKLPQINLDFEFDARDKGTSLCMQQVFLRRSFCRGSLELGGRFYGGWWQLIKSKLRRRILINGNRTVECDFSGLVFAMLYAREGLAMEADPYHINLITDTKLKRSLVKKFLLASINDETGKFTLSRAELKKLGLSHDQLVHLVKSNHSGINHFVGSGVGLQMQYLDSQLAERVILRMMTFGEVCLPIHDSFVVREEAEELLQTVMLEEFQALFGNSILIRLEKGVIGSSLSRPSASLLKPISTFEDLIKSYKQHTSAYSIVLGYLHSWETHNFSDAELEARDYVLNETRSLAKDSGKYFNAEYKFNGIPVFMRHLGMPLSSSLRETDLK